MSGEKFRNTNNKIYEGLFEKSQLPTSCLLCKTGTLHELGHIIPKFVMRWLKKQSKRKNFHFGNAKQFPVGDTLAIKMLCKTCEDRFGAAEKEFTDRYFKPFFRKNIFPSLEENLYFFALTVAWRILATARLSKPSEGWLKSCDQQEALIRSYLLDPTNLPEIDLFIFQAKEIADNLPDESYHYDRLYYTIRQGVFAQWLRYTPGWSASLSAVPLTHFKLGPYYFLIAPRNIIQRLTFFKEIRSKPNGIIHELKFTSELLGFLRHITNDDFDEVDQSVIPLGIKFDTVA